MKLVLLTIFSFLICATGAYTQSLRVVDAAKRSELELYLTTHYLSPEDYVLSKFSDHDVVFLVEQHYVKHDLELLQSLIPLLYNRGIFTLCIELARRDDQRLIDSLLAGRTYNEGLARLIMFNKNPHWPFQEYVDVYKKAWELNQTLPLGSRHFRILALNDSPDWSFVTKDEDRGNPKIMQKVWGNDEGEIKWANVILDNVVAKGEKALVYSGMHHAFTEYKQPISSQGKFIRFVDGRMGNFVFKGSARKL